MAALLTEKPETTGLADRLGLSRERAAAVYCSPGCLSHWDPRRLGGAGLRGKKVMGVLWGGRVPGCLLVRFFILFTFFFLSVGRLNFQCFVFYSI